MSRLLNIDDALELILAEVRPLETEPVSLGEARGRYLAEDAVAQVDLPPFPSSAMDGFAVRSADTPGSLPVVFRIAAGRPADRPLAAGEAMGIATGGVVPEGADAVIPIEYVVDHDNEVEIPDSVASGANVRPRGGDVRAGDVVARAGARVSAAQLGGLAAAGLPTVPARRRPRAAVLTKEGGGGRRGRGGGGERGGEGGGGEGGGGGGEDPHDGEPEGHDGEDHERGTPPAVPRSQGYRYGGRQRRAALDARRVHAGGAGRPRSEALLDRDWHHRAGEAHPDANRPCEQHDERSAGCDGPADPEDADQQDRRGDYGACTDPGA